MKIVDTCNLNIDFHSGKYKDFNEFLQLKARIDFILKREGIDNLPPEPKQKFGAVFYNFKLYVAKPEYEIIKSELMLLADRFTHYYYYEFSKAEVNESPLFIVSMESDNNSPSILGTKYHIETICSLCGLEKVTQLNELHINTSIMKNKKVLFQSINSEDLILISNDFLSVIRENNLTGFELKPVVHVGKENKKVEIHQLIPTNILPPVQPINIILEHKKEYCTSCGITGRTIFPLHYKPSEIDSFKDFNYQNEYLDMGKNAIRPLVISSNVKKIFDKMRIKGWFLPTLLTDNTLNLE